MNTSTEDISIAKVLTGDNRKMFSARTICVVGGGGAGLMLAIGLLRAGYIVRLLQDRSADQVANGRVMSSQCLFGEAVEQERALGIDFWSKDCPQISGISVNGLRPNTPVPDFSFTGRFSRPAESVDQRIKIPAWLACFEALGGLLEIGVADIAVLERCAKECELVIVASGKGLLSELFSRNERWSPFKRPMRALAMMYLNGVDTKCASSRITSTAFQGAGGVMRVPALAQSGPCDILVIEAAIGGPLDVDYRGMNTDDQWSAMHKAISGLMPLEAERLASASPTDVGAGLRGQITPTVRHAVGRLPSGRLVLGLGDAVVLNDPLVGQGANNAAKAAAYFVEAILSRRALPFDQAWMEAVAAVAWDRVRSATIWTNISLLPPSQELVTLLQSATIHQGMADRFAQAFEDPDLILSVLPRREAA